VSLESLLADLEKAKQLIREPRIYLTRAQVLSLRGELIEHYRVKDGPPSADTAILELQVARRLGLPARYFDQGSAQQTNLAWLWRVRPELMTTLSK
jgi:hypothetical protein